MSPKRHPERSVHELRENPIATRAKNSGVK
jgi:hypothetical protein